MTKSPDMRAEAECLIKVARARSAPFGAEERLAEAYLAIANRFNSLHDSLQRLHEDAKRWLTESDDRPNLRAAESRIAKLAAFAGCRCTDCCRRKFSETRTWGQAPSADGNPWAPAASAITDLRPGLYDLTFKGGYTALASVGLLRDGRRWFAVTTRVGDAALDAEHVACDDWSDVLCATPIRLAEGDGR